jgi:hypothetical protein
MLKKEPDNYLANTEFSLADIAYDGSDNYTDSKEKDLVFRDLTEKELKDFNLESASIVGELFLYGNNNQGGKLNGFKHTERTSDTRIQMSCTFALIDDKLY